MRIRTLLGFVISTTLACAGREDESPSSTPAPIGRESVFARTDSTFVPVAGDADWPEQFEAAVVVVRDSGARIVAVQEEPRSESGDWSLLYRHTFDTAGATVRYESVGRYFGACPGVTEARFVLESDPAGSPPRATRTLRDSAGTDRDQRACDHPYEFFDGTPMPSLAALIAARRVPQAP